MDGIRSLTEEDIGQALELSVAEGWNQTRSDWLFLIRNPENVCLAYEIDGVVVATATAVVYQKKLAWIGMVLVQIQHRGKGYSKLLLTQMLKAIDFVQFIQLDATPAGLPVYQKLGFKTGYKISRMVIDQIHVNDILNNCTHGVKSYYDTCLPDLLKYDVGRYGLKRSVLIEYLVNTYPELVRIIREESTIKGYLLGRRGARFLHLGPLVSSDINIARDLIRNILLTQTEQPVIVDVPENQFILKEWLEQVGFVESRHFHRMYYNDSDFEGNMCRQMLICGPEFG